MGTGISCKNRLAWWLACLLPWRIVYYAVVRAREAAEKVQKATPSIEVEENITASGILSMLTVIMRDKLDV